MLYIVSTPIGNIKDITFRAIEVLRSVDKVYAEDTRVTRKLLSSYDIHVPLFSFHKYSPEKVEEHIVSAVEHGQNVALVSDAGMPGLSDPGYQIIRKAVKLDLPVTVIPGPSALLCALLISGFLPYPFAFLGFPPSRGKKRREFFESYAHLSMTIIIFEAPHRIRQTLEDILRHWGNRSVVLAREMTKIHEEVIRGTVKDIIMEVLERDRIRGEITLVISGLRQEKIASPQDEWVAELSQQLNQPGARLADVVRSVSREFCLPRNTVYRTAIKLSRRGDNDSTP